MRIGKGVAVGRLQVFRNGFVNLKTLMSPPTLRKAGEPTGIFHGFI